MSNMNLIFDQKLRYKRLDRLYDIKKKYLRYLSTNRNIYRLYKFKTKNNFKFIKKHIRAVSNLNLKDRVHMHEYSIRNIIIKLKYAFTFRNSNNLIKSGFIFLNGLQTLNSKFFLFKNDCLELIYNKFVLNLKKKIKRKMYISMRRYKKYN